MLKRETHLCLLVHWSSFFHASTPAPPVQELLSEQSRLVVLWNAAEQSPAGTPLSPPEDTIRDLVQSPALKGTHFKEYNAVNS